MWTFKFRQLHLYHWLFLFWQFCCFFPPWKGAIKRNNLVGQWPPWAEQILTQLFPLDFVRRWRFRILPGQRLHYTCTHVRPDESFSSPLQVLPLLLLLLFHRENYYYYYLLWKEGTVTIQTTFYFLQDEGRLLWQIKIYLKRLQNTGIHPSDIFPINTFTTDDPHLLKRFSYE